jgi:tetratricopeptide (TPR) repeat protein
MRPARSILALLLLLLLLLLPAGCSREYSYYLPRGGEEKAEMRTLFHLLDREKEVGENRFIIVQQIANRLHAVGELDKLILFLTTYVEKNPEDPYNAYYLSIVAAAYKQQGALPLAVHYYDRILKNHPDLLVSGTTLHYQCLQELLSLVKEPRARIEYYKELIARFGEYIDTGAAYYYLATAYEQVGEWEQAMRVYQKFLTYPETQIPGDPRAHIKVREKVEFYYSDKSWTAENLQLLVDGIRQAILTRNTRKLLAYRARVNFFTMSWSQADADESVSMVFDIGAFLQASRVQADDALDMDSNAGEAFLRTTRWSYRIPTWYLYFRKVDFKPDPDINGRWEWAGIYFGEKL